MRGVLSLVTVGVAAALVGAAHARVAHPPPTQREARFVPRPEVARVASLGFAPLVADWYWMQAVQIVGASNGDPTAYAELLGRLVDVVTSVDPWVGHPYRFAAHWLTDTPERVRFANGLLERAIEHHPDDWRNYFYLGFNRFFYLGEQQAAADAFAAAVPLPEAPLYLGRLVARLRADATGLDTAAALLQEMAQSAEDEQARRHYESALLEIETERRARVLDAARERFRSSVGRDIKSVDELRAVLGRELPPEPNGTHWILKDGRIVAFALGRRYEAWMSPGERERRQRWLEEKRG